MVVIHAVGSVVGVIVNVINRVLRMIGFTISLPPRLPKNCDDAGQQPGCGSNPRVCGTSEVIARGATGGLAEYTQCGTGPHTLVAVTGGFTGLDAAAGAELRFAPASVVTVSVVRFAGSARVEAFTVGGGSAGTQIMTAPAGVEQQFTFNGAGINRVLVASACSSK